MKILIVHHSVIPAILYGGTERVIWALGKKLQQMGLNVTYLVNKGSYCDFAKVVFINHQKPISAQIPQDVDVVHFNFTPNDLDINKPYIVTIHGNAFCQEILDTNSVFVSQNHAQRHGSSSFVHNGLDWDEYRKPDLTSPRKDFHFLGNARWKVKNVVGAIQMIRNIDQEHLNVLGGVRFNFSMGMRFTFSPKILFYGMVGGEEKDMLLNRSKGLIFPVRWHEPFGLAIIESLYFGCPVFATPYGSIPEIVNASVGYYSNKMTDLIDAIKNSHTYNPIICHEYALDNFNSHKMALSYLTKYEQVLSNQKMNSTNPRLQEMPNEKLLAWNTE